MFVAEPGEDDVAADADGEVGVNSGGPVRRR